MLNGLLSVSAKTIILFLSGLACHGGFLPSSFVFQSPLRTGNETKIIDESKTIDSNQHTLGYEKDRDKRLEPLWAGAKVE